MQTANPYKDFTKRLKLLIEKHPSLIVTTLSNVFTMRLIGNKTHGDLAEIAISEFINQYMYDFKSTHVGKDLFRAKEHEEDIIIKNEITDVEFPVSLKAYGNGPLQLSTNKESQMFTKLEQEGDNITNKDALERIFNDEAFKEFSNTNVLPLIYDETKKKCNILVFDYERAKQNTVHISRNDKGKNRKHPVYRFYDKEKSYICEVRYGNAEANALQRGLWTHTKNGIKYFNSVTNGWIDYSHNLVLVKLFSHALISSPSSHEKALEEIKKGIKQLKEDNDLKK